MWGQLPPISATCIRACRSIPPAILDNRAKTTSYYLKNLMIQIALRKFSHYSLAEVNKPNF